MAKSVTETPREVLWGATCPFNTNKVREIREVYGFKVGQIVMFNHNGKFLEGATIIAIGNHATDKKTYKEVILFVIKNAEDTIFWKERRDLII